MQILRIHAVFGVLLCTACGYSILVFYQAMQAYQVKVVKVNVNLYSASS